MSTAFSIDLVTWEEDAATLLSVRQPVFVVEQGVAADREVDEYDPVSLHLLARDESGHPIGTARLLPDGRIGRVAVLKEWRRCGVGRALMLAALAAARDGGHERVSLHAQTHSLSFYESLGFIAFGDEFEEEGIPHREMERRLDPPAPGKRA